MAYKRRRFVRRRFVKRRRLGRRRAAPYGGFIKSAAWAAKQIWKLKGLVNSEMYKLDTVWTPALMTNGFCSLIPKIAIGDGDSDRTGNSIFARSFNFSGQLTHNATGANNQVVRISVIMDTQQIGDTSPSYTDIYETTSPYAHLNSNTVGRFKVLFSQTYVVNNYDKNLALVRINLPMRHHIRYNGSAITDIQRGGLYICAACDEPGTADKMPLIGGEHRLSYHDN